MLQQEFGKILVQCDHQIRTHFRIIVSITTFRISAELPIFQKSGRGTTAYHSFGGYFGYLLAFICCGACTLTL